MDIVDIKEWASQGVKKITVTQDVGGISYDFNVRRFVPRAGDALARKWKTNGVEQAFECAPYGIANMAEAGGMLAQVVDRTTNDQLNFYVDESDMLMRNTYVMASRYSLVAEVRSSTPSLVIQTVLESYMIAGFSLPAGCAWTKTASFANQDSQREEERRLLQSVFRLWCASRMESRSDRICGLETLGMQPQDYGPGCLNSGLILLPPVFGAQLEIIMTTLILEPAKRAVLRLLKDLILENRRSSWFTIYLCLFILLHSCAMLTAGDNKKARKQGMEVRDCQTVASTPVLRVLRSPLRSWKLTIL